MKNTIPEPCSRTANDRVTTLLRPCLTARASTSTSILPRCNGRAQRGWAFSRFARGSGAMFRFSAPRPFSAAGTLCGGRGKPTLPIFADALFFYKYKRSIPQSQISVKGNQIPAPPFVLSHFLQFFRKKLLHIAKSWCILSTDKQKGVMRMTIIRAMVDLDDLIFQDQTSCHSER